MPTLGGMKSSPRPRAVSSVSTASIASAIGRPTLATSRYERYRSSPPGCASVVMSTLRRKYSAASRLRATGGENVPNPARCLPDADAGRGDADRLGVGGGHALRRQPDARDPLRVLVQVRPQLGGGQPRREQLGAPLDADDVAAVAVVGQMQRHSRVGSQVAQLAALRPAEQQDGAAVPEEPDWRGLWLAAGRHRGQPDNLF